MGGGISQNLLKYLSLSCLTISIISVISLNIIRTYSINNTRTNALDNQPTAQTDSIDPRGIALSLANATGSHSPTSGNITVTQPAGGGIVTGSHTLTVRTGSRTSGYTVTLTSQDSNAELSPAAATNPHRISPVGGTDHPAPLNQPTTLKDNQWGVALPSSTLYPNKYSNTNDYTSTNQPTLANTTYAAIPTGSRSGSTILTKQTPANQATGDSTTIYYGVNVSPNLRADTYTAKVTYTATATVPAPTLSHLVLNDSIQANQTSEFAIEGTNLDTVYKIRLCPTATGQAGDCYETTDLQTYTDQTATTPLGTVLSFTNPAISEPGLYDLYVLSPTGQTKLDQPFIVQEESICRNADPNSDCQVDIDDNMIPIYYAGNNTDGSAIWKVANINNPGEWYDYTKKQWANAVTVQSAKLTAYQNKPGTVINNNDTLGYWVYIPRYAYEVQRPNAIDRVVTDEYPLPDNTNSTGDFNSPYNTHSIRNEFSIHFEKATDTKKTPAETCNILNPTKEQMWANGTPTNQAGPDNTNILAKDYRTTCVNESSGTITRTYGSATGTTWATHPAFSWLDNDGNGEELNGLWVGKFETTGTVTNPTIKPNQHANVIEYIGEFYTMARSIGVGTYDPTNNGGNTISGIAQNSHNLAESTSHMLKNSEWGAIAYLASSKYGAGTNNVSINSAQPTTSTSISTDADDDSTVYGGVTGCGPNNSQRSTATYTDGTPLSQSTIESLTACSTDPALATRRTYTGDIGQLASTTNNVYGIYDMSGGVYEYVMGNLTSSDTETTPYDTTTMQNQAKPPYVDLYKESLGFGSTYSNDTNPAWSYSTNGTYYDNDICTWGTCGGDALHETKQYQSVSGYGQSWGGDYSWLVSSGKRWFGRGGYASYGSYSGLFSSSGSSGYGYYDVGLRSVLLAAP